MVPRIFQPVIIILVVGVLALLRMASSLDPLQRWLGGDVSQEKSAFDLAGGLADQLAAENQRLRQELDFAEDGKSYVRAEVLGKTVASFREAVRIGAGQKHGLRPDQAVLSQGYLIGRVGSVEDGLATVLLLGDPDVRIPVVIGQARGIVLPQAGGLVIDQVVGDVEPGQTVLSSGIDGLYPPGLAIGTVGDELERNIFGRYVLNTPLDTHQLNFVSIRLD